MYEPSPSSSGSSKVGVTSCWRMAFKMQAAVESPNFVVGFEQGPRTPIQFDEPSHNSTRSSEGPRLPHFFDDFQIPLAQQFTLLKAEHGAGFSGNGAAVATAGDQMILLKRQEQNNAKWAK